MWVIRGKWSINQSTLSSKLNKIKHMCIHKKIPSFGISTHSKILSLANVPCKADAKYSAHRVAFKSTSWKHTWKRLTNCRTGLYIDFFYWHFSIWLAQSHQHTKPPKITELNCPEQVQTKDFYILHFLFSALMCLLDAGFTKLPCSLQSRDTAVHFSLADVYWAHLG